MVFSLYSPSGRVEILRVVHRLDSFSSSQTRGWLVPSREEVSTGRNVQEFRWEIFATIFAERYFEREQRLKEGITDDQDELWQTVVDYTQTEFERWKSVKQTGVPSEEVTNEPEMPAGM